MIIDQNFKTDNVLKISLIEDIINAMIFIKNSSFKYHGKLKPSNCLVDMNWKLSVADLGLDRINRTYYDKSYNEFDENFVAPEILTISYKCRHMKSNIEADVYSFGKIMRMVFQLDNSVPVLHDIYKGNVSHIGKTDINSFMKYDAQHFLNDLEDIAYVCLKRNPKHRITFEEISFEFKKIVKKIGCDSDQTILERFIKRLIYTVENLDEIFQDSEREIKNYVNKYNLLLEETFPKSVSQAIRNEQRYQSTDIESVTVMFLDIPDFKIKCEKKNPFQIVEYLNHIYNILDQIIERHQVFKLETIGDAYVVVAGLTEALNLDESSVPVSDQVYCIVELAREIMDEFLQHPTYGQVRMGIHSGSVTAGVIGCLTPRFCLFGDTMNTAARMKSTGKRD